ncbi:hypothetical protein [Streptomyces sp. WMMB303]|uniref:hypothetical protein n=1 Tax=Streptomyces sp. WMMB303 TaxID=3034154 RepID=UPI0023EDE72D|nr:hypothetical protein [Streptomyces sp. WMMB303]MDF4251183.1 hypothetical protein [Streptomyces sp. WMMB303]
MLFLVALAAGMAGLSYAVSQISLDTAYAVWALSVNGRTTRGHCLHAPAMPLR